MVDDVEDCVAAEEVHAIADMAPLRQSRPDFGLGFQVKVLAISQEVPSAVLYFAEM